MSGKVEVFDSIGEKYFGGIRNDPGHPRSPADNLLNVDNKEENERSDSPYPHPSLDVLIIPFEDPYFSEISANDKLIIKNMLSAEQNTDILIRFLKGQGYNDKVITAAINHYSIKLEYEVLERVLGTVKDHDIEVSESSAAAMPRPPSLPEVSYKAMIKDSLTMKSSLTIDPVEVDFAGMSAFVDNSF